VGSTASGNTAIWEVEGRPEVMTSIRWLRGKQEQVGGERRRPDGETGGDRQTGGSGRRTDGDRRRPGGGRGRREGSRRGRPEGHHGSQGSRPSQSFFFLVSPLRTVGQIEERCDLRNGPTRTLCRPRTNEIELCPCRSSVSS
jgi:hypothetical protein